MEEKKKEVKATQSERKEMSKEALKAISELEESVKYENIVKDNKIVFKSGENVLRVRKPTILEQQELNTIKRKKYIEFVDDKTYLFRKQWIKKYKEKGIDLDKMSSDVRRLQGEIKKLFLRLAETKDKKSIEELKKEILRSRDQQVDISMERTDLLSHSIEDQLVIYVNSYSTYLVLEKKDGDKWERYFKSYEDFQNSEEWDLLDKAFRYISLLIYAVEQ